MSPIKITTVPRGVLTRRGLVDLMVLLARERRPLTPEEREFFARLLDPNLDFRPTAATRTGSRG